MKGRRPSLDAAQRTWVRQWWQALQPRDRDNNNSEDPPAPNILRTFDRGTRAKLRRCTRAEDLLSQPAALVLADRLIRKDDSRWPLTDEPATYLHVTLTAGILARIKRDTTDGKTLALLLGARAPGSDRPTMSELRFRRLQGSRSKADLLLLMQRAVQLVDAIDVAQLADDLLTWLAEHDRPFGSASDSVKFRWAYDYYLSPRDRKAADLPVSDKELTL